MMVNRASEPPVPVDGEPASPLCFVHERPIIIENKNATTKVLHLITKV
jgi:hypothetical protein